MDGWKVRHALSSLEQEGLVMFKVIKESLRIKKLTFPVSYFKLIPKDLRTSLKNKLSYIT
jgi:hypothetical protein